MRNYCWVDKYLNELRDDIYPQPPDEGHTGWAMSVIHQWMHLLHDDHSVIDVGCGEAFLQDTFANLNMMYLGVCLGEQDYEQSLQQRKNVQQLDFHFLPYFDNYFDLVFARHSLEHSPMPILALMEWNRIARHHLILVNPNPDFWGRVGRNHYSVLYDDQIKFLLDRSGWELVETNTTEQELQYFCHKLKRTD